METKRVEWIAYNDKEVLYCDFRELEDNEIIEMIKYIDELITNSDKKNILKINDVRGLYVSAQVLPEIKRSSALLKPYLKRSAYVGITGSKKTLLKIVNSISNIGAKPFTEPDKAFEWITAG